MLASPSVIRAAELRRLDFLNEAARERQIDAALAAFRPADRVIATPMGTPVISPLTALSALITVLLARRIPRAA